MKLDQVVPPIGPGHDRKVGAACIRYSDLPRREASPVRFDLRAIGSPTRSFVPYRERAPRLTSNQWRKPPLTLLIRAGRNQHQHRAHVREEGGRGERVAHLLGDHHQLDRSQAQTAIRFRDDHAGPPELDDLLPLLIGEPALVLGQLAHRLRLVASLEKFPRGALDRLLIVGEVEVHQRMRGSPSTRSATMFLRISVLPPSIEFARARRNR